MLKIIRSILITLQSNRIYPHRLLTPPITVKTRIIPQIMSPISHRQIFLEDVYISEVLLNVTMDLRGENTDRPLRVLDIMMKFLILIKKDEEIKKYIDIEPENLPEELKRQIISYTVNDAIPLIVNLTDKHMLPIPIPIEIVEQQ